MRFLMDIEDHALEWLRVLDAQVDAVKQKARERGGKLSPESSTTGELCETMAMRITRRVPETGARDGLLFAVCRDPSRDPSEGLRLHCGPRRAGGGGHARGGGRPG